MKKDKMLVRIRYDESRDEFCIETSVNGGEWGLVTGCVQSVLQNAQ